MTDIKATGFLTSYTMECMDFSLFFVFVNGNAWIQSILRPCENSLFRT